MRFVKSDGIKVGVFPEQAEFVGTPDMISTVLGREEVIGFDIFDGDLLVGFAMLRKYKDEETGDSCWFLWEYVIDSSLQGKGYGKKPSASFSGLCKENTAQGFSQRLISGETPLQKVFTRASALSKPMLWTSRTATRLI